MSVPGKPVGTQTGHTTGHGDKPVSQRPWIEVGGELWPDLSRPKTPVPTASKNIIGGSTGRTSISVHEALERFGRRMRARYGG